MVVAKAQHKHHSTVYDLHNCMRLLKMCCLKSVVLIFQQGGAWWLCISKLKYLASSLILPLVNTIKRCWKHYTKSSHVDLYYFNRPIIRQILWIFSHSYDSIPICHNEGFEMHNDIHHITINMMNNYILFNYIFLKLLFSFQYIDIMYLLLS